MILLELLRITERHREAHQLECSMLLEHLGNLAEIDRKLVKILTGKFKKEVGSNKVVANVGATSKIEEFPVANSNQVMKRMTDKDSDVVATVVKYGERQVVAIASRHKMYGAGGYKDTTDDWFIIVTDDFFDLVGPAKDYHDAHTKETQKYSNRTHKPFTTKSLEAHNARDLLDGIGVQGGYTHFGNSTKANTANAKKVIDFMFTQAKEAGVKITILTISKDIERKATALKRSNDRYGRIPLTTEKSIKKFSAAQKSEYARWKSNLIDDYKEKLEKWKIANAEKKSANNFESDKEMVEFMAKNGFPDKINFGGYVYDKDRVEIRWEELQKKADGTMTAYEKANPSSFSDYISYKIVRKSAKFQELVDKVKELRAGIPSDAEVADDKDAKESQDLITRAVENKLKRIVPPGKIYVHMTLKGGTVSPTDITAVLGDNEYIY